ncbi:DUF805 domain-containing protein [Citrobacter koseri]|uniref:DUF805 domain-containing protein n=1 Tax=Citrobacter koseri TaxID=545 RepID=UPI0019033CC1|nr:DUF805 domain-containing protein [Citrobacter koseri]MBJ9353567.1 DUF805 domain-containing protein [Citrobacter koseri]
MKAYIDFFRHYVNWRGRTGRKGYWLFVLINIIIIFVLQILDRIIATTFLGFSSQEVNSHGGIYILTVLYILATFIPNITLSIRRLHDINKSGWWLLLSLIPIAGSLILLIFACLKSDGGNRFGNQPLDGYTV